MPSINIEDSQLAALKDQVVVVTGGSSGIGLATVQKLLEHGAKVVSGDLSPPKTDSDGDAFTFQACDVSSWASLIALFKLAHAKYGRIDHVFANAGISNYKKESYVDDMPLDPATGDPLEPDHTVLAVNLIGVMNTVRLAIHHFRTQPAAASSCSIVITASGAAFNRFGLSEYTASKHGVLGFMRSLQDQFSRHSLAGAIRVNTVAPSFTDTGIINAPQVRAWGMVVQSAEVVARSVAWLMAEQTCDQRVVYSHGGRFREIEGELLAASKAVMGTDVSAPTQQQQEPGSVGEVLDLTSGFPDT